MRLCRIFGAIRSLFYVSERDVEAAKYRLEKAKIEAAETGKSGARKVFLAGQKSLKKQLKKDLRKQLRQGRISKDEYKRIIHSL